MGRADVVLVVEVEVGVVDEEVVDVAIVVVVVVEVVEVLDQEVV